MLRTKRNSERVGLVKINSLKREQNKRFNIKKEITAWLFMIPMLLILYFIIVRPQINGIYLSFFKLQGYTPVKFAGFDNYIKVLKDKDFIPTLWNTIKYVLWSLAIGYPIPVILAFLINEMVHFKNAFKMAIYLPSVLPAVVFMLLWTMMYNPGETGFFNIILGKIGLAPYIWLNDGRFTILGLILSMTWHGAGGSMLLYYAVLQSIPLELYEAATTDGAGPLRKFIHISLPQISGMLLLSLIQQIISVFQVLQQPMVMTGGGPNGASNSLAYLAYKYGFVSGRVGNALALGTVMFIILIFATIFYFRLQKRVEDNY